MQLTLPVNYNYGQNKIGWTADELKQKLNIRSKGVLHQVLANCFDSYEEVYLTDDRFSNLNVISLRKSSLHDEDIDSFVIRFYKREYYGVTKYFIETGQYAGYINFKRISIFISLSEKYNIHVLNHLLSYANNINIDSLPLPTNFTKNQSELDYLLCFLFIQRLEKASILGLPKQYVNKNDQLSTVKGKIDFNQFIKNNLPFKGEIAVRYRKREEVQEIIDVVFYTLYIIKNKFSSQALFKVRSIYNELKSRYSKSKPNSSTIIKAKRHSVLNNPIFQQFKVVLELAEIIIKNLSPEIENEKSLEISGNLYNTSELFELYIEKILKINFSDWHIEPQKEISIYKKQFFGRKLKPDFVLYNQESDNYVVLDVKFKTMNYSRFDLDREDLFQLHTYTYYFHNNIVYSGLIYPLQFIRDTIISTDTLDKFENKFGVLGIELNAKSNYDSIRSSEIVFINNLSQLITKNN